MSEAEERYAETRDKIVAARERQLADALAEIERLKAAYEIQMRKTDAAEAEVIRLRQRLVATLQDLR